MGTFNAELLDRSKFVQYLILGKKSKWLQQFSCKNRNAVIRRRRSTPHCEFRSGVPMFDLKEAVSGGFKQKFSEKPGELHYKRRH